MNAGVILISICSIVFDLYTINKIRKGKDINLIDLLSVMYSVYFIVTPIKCALTKTQFYGVDTLLIINQSLEAFLIIFVLKLIFFILNRLFTQKIDNSGKYNFVNITSFMRDIDDKIILTPKFIYIIIAFFFLLLIPIVDYSNMSEDNTESNLTYFYGENMPFIQRVIIQMVYHSTSVFMILAIKYRFNAVGSKYKRLANFALLIALVIMLLRGRTNMLNDSIIICLYLYSTKKYLFSRKGVFLIVSMYAFMVFVYFPVYQTFRTAKEYVVKNQSEHSFVDVVHYCLTNDLTQLSEDANEIGSKARSFGVFGTYYLSVNGKYRHLDGQYIKDQIFCVNPFYKPSERLYASFAHRIANGGDVSESVLAVMMIDIGIYGVIVVPILYMLYIFLLFNVTKVTYKYIKNEELWLLFLCMAINRVLSVEGFGSIREIYNPGITVLIAFSIIMVIFNKSKKYIYG